MRTAYPLASNASTVWDPMKPAPPVTRTLSVNRSLPAGPSYDAPESTHQDLDVEPQRPAIDIVQVHADPIIEVADSVAAVHLPQTRDTGSNTELPLLPELVTFELVSERRSRANKAHIPFQNTVQLRQLIETVLTQYAP